MKVLQMDDVQLAQEIIPLNEQKGGIGLGGLTAAGSFLYDINRDGEAIKYGLLCSGRYIHTISGWNEIQQERKVKSLALLLVYFLQSVCAF